MLTIKNRANGAIFVLGLLGVAAWMGCSPPGPRLLLKGEQLIQQGKPAEAVKVLSEAIEELPENAAAWNLLGLAYHHSREPVKAAQAYQQAINRDRDYFSTYYNLGRLYLEQNHLSGAIDALTTYTTLQPKVYDGWYQLGSAQLRLAQALANPERLTQLEAARRSLEQALKLQNSREALNALGMIHVQRGRPRDALPYFNAAVQQEPDYAPALLNLAITHQHLNDRPAALQSYHAYLSLDPRPADWAAVRQLYAALQPPPRTEPAPATAPLAQTAPQPSPDPAQPAPVTNAVAARPAPATQPKPEPVVPQPVPATQPRPETATVQPAPAPQPKPDPAPKPPPLEVTRVPDEPPIRSAAESVQVATRPAPATQVPDEPPPATTPGVAPAETTSARPTSPPAPRAQSERTRLSPGAWFGKRETPATSSTIPLPDKTATARPVATPEKTAAPAPRPQPQPVYPRYTYRNPPKPAPGNRANADSFFSRGLEAHGGRRHAEAMQYYRRAAEADPAYFEAHYNLGLAAYELGELPASLLAYETALAIDPMSLQARYNFALALQKGNYLQDAAREFGKVLAGSPRDVRAHFSLANLYAQQLYQTELARQHYQRVLELEPRHPQAAAIRYWLVANP